MLETEARIGVADEPLEVGDAVEQHDVIVGVALPFTGWGCFVANVALQGEWGREPRFEIAQTLSDQERWLNRGTVFGNRLIISVERRSSVHTPFGTAEHGITRGCKPSKFMGGEGSSKEMRCVIVYEERKLA